MAGMAGIQTSYTYLRRGAIARQVCVGDEVIFDVDSEGCLVGAETIGRQDWRDALAALAMAGRLRIVQA